MLFSLFKTKEEKEALMKIEHFCINDYRKNKKINLEEIQKQLNNIRFKISQRDKTKMFINFLQVFDGKYSPEECIDHFNDLANLLSVRNAGKIKTILDDLENDAEKARKINKIMGMKKLPIIDVDIILKKGEEAYFYTQVTFYEERTKRIYQGRSAGTSIRVAKGISFRVGANKGNAVNEDYLKEIDSGEFIITNKRIVFVGDNKSWNIVLVKLVRIEATTINGLLALEFSIETASKKKMVTFESEDEKIEAETILKKLVHGSNTFE